MKVAAVQHDIVWNDRHANFERLAPRIGDAAACGADLVVLTETFSTGFVVDVAEIGEPEGGPSAQFLASPGRRARCVGLRQLSGDPRPMPRRGDRRPFNSFVFAGPDGTTHRYRKIHSFTYGGEPKHFRAGDELTTFTIAGARVTPLVCYDLRFADEFWQRAAGTDVFVVTANWPAPRRLHWQALLQARAIENLAYVVGMQPGRHPAEVSTTPATAGSSTRSASCWRPPPATRRRCSATVDPDRVTDVRARFGFLDDRR